ncbi:hypothetical protein Tco_1338965, partial [Tanacetum coccineum]
EVSFDDNEVTEVKALMALTDEERVSVGKESAKNGDWSKISMKRVHTLLEMEDNDDRKSFLDYLYIDLNYVEEQRNNLLSKHRNLVQELNTCKEQLLVLKQAKLDLLTIQHCINEQIPTQKKKILGIDQLAEDTSSFVSKNLVFVKSLADNSDMPITSSNIPKSSEAEDSTLPKHDNSEVTSNESQRNTTDPSVVVSDSSATNYDPANESLVCSTPLPPLKKLDGVEHVSRPKIIKSTLKSNFTFKAETLKGIIINELSSAPSRGKKSSSASKTNSAPTGKLKNVKIEDVPLLPIAMKELNELKLQISKKKDCNTRTDAELAVAVQAAVDAMLPHIREQVREEYRTGAVASGSNPPPVTIHTWLERFNKQKPRSFEKAVAPVDAENWISHMEKIFDVMDCNDAFKTRLDVYKFEGDALA